MKLQSYLIHSSLLLIPKPLIFPKQNVQMSSQQPSGDSKTLIIDSQQPPADSKTINVSMEKRANVFNATFWIFQIPSIFQLKNVQMSSRQPSGDSKTLMIGSQQPPADSKTINISIEKRTNIFTAASWIFRNINNEFTAASCRFQNHQYFNGKHVHMFSQQPS